MSYSSEVLADSPLVFYPLGGTTGAAVDESGNGRDGSWNAIPPLGDKLGAGLAGSSSNNEGNKRVTLSDAAWMDTAQVSVEMWFKFPTSGTWNAGLASRFQDPPYSWLLWISTSDEITFRIYVGTTAYNVKGPIPAAGAVYHAVGTFDGATVRLFVNGAEVASTPAAGSLAASAAPLNVGAYQDFHINGHMQAFALYGTGLSAARVAAHYNAGVAAGGVDLALAGTAQPAAAAFDLTHTAAPVDVTLAGTASAAAGSFLVDSQPLPPAVIDVTLAGAASAATATFTLTTPSVTTDLTLAGTAGAPTASFRFDNQSAATETFYRNNGRGRTGLGYAVVDYPIAAESPRRVPIRVTGVSVPAPTLSNGVPQ